MVDARTDLENPRLVLFLAQTLMGKRKFRMNVENADDARLTRGCI